MLVYDKPNGEEMLFFHSLKYKTKKKKKEKMMTIIYTVKKGVRHRSLSLDYMPAIPTTIIITGFLLKLIDEDPTAADDDSSTCNFPIDLESSSFSSFLDHTKKAEKN